MDDVDLLINKCIIGDEKKHKCKYASSQYKHALFIYRKKDDYMEAEICDFQLSVDWIYLIFWSMYGQDFATNYWHMLSSLHFHYYMKKWKCFYQYSNQGWEALNWLVKSFLSRQTNHGGGKDWMKSKLHLIANLFLCHLFWMLGWLKDFEDSHSIPTNDGEETGHDIHEIRL